MRIKLFETFETPSFKEVWHEEFIEKLDARRRASWFDREIEEVTKLFQEELGWKNCKVIDSNAPFPTAFILIEILNEEGLIPNSPWEVLNLYIIKQEDEWFLITGNPMPEAFECDQFSGLVDCIKQLFTK
jgi:hypothetical protein